MDPSIVKLLEDVEDETMHSGVDVEAFQAALNRDIGDVSTSQFSGSDSVLSQGSNNTSSKSLPQWPTSNHDSQTDSQNQEPKTAQQQEQPSSEMELKQHGCRVEQLQHVSSQDVNNPLLSQKQSQDECHQAPAVQVSLQNSQAIRIQNSGKDPVLNNEVGKNHNPNSESQYAKLQQMSNQQATVPEQPSTPGNRSKQVPFGLLLPILIPQLPKDRAMQLQTLFAKLKKDEIPKDSFVRLMKGIVGDKMLRLAIATLQMQPQTRPNQASVGQQHPVRMPRQLNDPHALAQMHQRSMNASVDQSRMTSSAGQTMESNARNSQELDVKIESQGLQPSQLPSSTSTAVGQEAERSSVHIQGLNKQQQQHLHFPSAYGNSGGNYSPFSMTTSSSTSSIKPQPHDSRISQISHHSIGSNHLGGSTHGMNVIGMPKLEQHNSFHDPKRLPGGSVSSAVNHTASQQTSNAWQPSINKEQNLGLMSSVSYVKKEPSDLSTEQQNRHNLTKLHGYSSVNSAQIEQGGASQGIVKDEFSRGLPASTTMPPTTSSGLLPHSSASPSAMTQLDPSVSIPSNASGIVARTPPKKPAVAQKKPLEALGSSPPPPSKKQKASGGSVEQSIEQLNDVTAVSGVDLREEEEQLFSGPKEDSRVSEASRKAVQEEEERLILQKAPLQKKLIDISWMAQQGAGLSYRQLMRNRAPAGSSTEDHRNITMDTRPTAATALPQPPTVIALPDPNARKRKDKGKRKADAAAAGESVRPKHRRSESTSTDLAIPSAIVAKDFLSGDIRPARMLSSDLLSEAGHRMLESATPTAQWAMACELQVRATAILRKLALEPMADMHNMRKHLEETKLAFQQSVEAHEVTANEKLALEAEVAQLKEVSGEWEGRALAAEAAERMRIQEIEEMSARLQQAKADVDAAMAAFRSECKGRIVKEHEEGFWHAARQATHFGTFPPGFSFDLNKDFFQGAFLDFNEADADAEPDQVAPPRSAPPEDPGTTVNEDEETEQTTNAD